MSLLWWLKYSDRQLVICVSNSEFDHNLSSYFSLSIYPDMSISSFCCSWALKCVLSEKWLTLEIVVVKAALTQLPPWFDAMTAENWSHPICTQQYNDYMCNMKQKHATYSREQKKHLSKCNAFSHRSAQRLFYASARIFFIERWTQQDTMTGMT